MRPKISRRLSISNYDFNLSKNQKEIDNEIFRDLKLKHYLRDLWNSFYIKFRSILKSYREKKATQDEWVLELFNFIFTLTPENQPEIFNFKNSDSVNDKHQLSDFNDRYLRIKWFLELMQVPKNMRRGDKNSRKFMETKISPLFPVFPQEIMKIVIYQTITFIDQIFKSS